MHYHPSILSVVKHRSINDIWELVQAMEAFVEYYNHDRYLEALDNLIPADVSFGRIEEMVIYRELTKYKSIQNR